MNIAESPRLHVNCKTLGTHTEDWACVYAIEREVEFPEARWYWIQLSEKQWPDGSGCRVTARRMGPDLHCRFRAESWSWAPPVLLGLGRKLDIKLDKTPRTFYFRLLYEE